jgi:hypothetical protein
LAQHFVCIFHSHLPIGQILFHSACLPIPPGRSSLIGYFDFGLNPSTSSFGAIAAETEATYKVSRPFRVTGMANLLE